MILWNSSIFILHSSIIQVVAYVWQWLNGKVVISIQQNIWTQSAIIWGMEKPIAWNASFYSHLTDEGHTVLEREQESREGQPLLISSLCPLFQPHIFLVLMPTLTQSTGINSHSFCKHGREFLFFFSSSFPFQYGHVFVRTPSDVFLVFLVNIC